ncbi:signal transduction histidine kinase/ActR/RegA family two-component response regulator [Pelomonas saccharophila]|uniref:histidine kinase n=1 Tax=Roseateles saccharophilus TaxID=304 RepID=A0ABU1YIF9_ROSSA|nr:ATP-binding protein [Roseateles saccharophilus]MDR7268638.1 signal transduction histidine kinase/ActR/RegA family two-component response regulator [Roseateles saccharophilus]
MPVTIRSRLLLLVLSVLLPGMLGVAWLIASTFEAERNAHERNLRDTARALSMLVDGELSRRAAIAHVLAQSPALDAPAPLDEDKRLAFERLARRAMQGLDGWIELRAPGRLLLSTRLPEGSGGESAGPATLSASPIMLPLQSSGPSSAGEAQEPHAAWVEPVMRNGSLLYNLVVTVRPSELQRLVQAQAPHPGWIGTVMDSRGRLVARLPGGASFVGRQGSADLLERMAAEREGAFQSVSLDGRPTAGYFSTSALGWSYVSAMPREEFAGRMPQAVQRVAVGALVLLALAMAGAVWVSRRIERPMRSLKRLAQDLQAGRPVEARPTGMAESDEVAEALVSAGRSMTSARAELERSVAEAVERTRQVEQRGAQSQRVVALGRLTGGVAHEFNNLLGVISNSMHLMQRHASAAELQGPLSATQRSVDKGSQLTQHLLRFAGKRPVRVQTLSLARYLPEVQELMRSVLGRRIAIQVQVPANVWPVRVDVNELDLALVNLALNAHDAMPSGGELRLRACNAEAADKEGMPNLAPGDYVLLTVSDDGMGLAPSLVEHAFEPFFTTKAVGQGSGLGLSQVHGFATQAGGGARLASTPGVGTTVSLLLPVAGNSPDQTTPVFDDVTQQSIAGITVLLVEDDEALGDVTAALLMSHGARVLRAGDAGAALRLLEDGAQADVVLSDVVMPGPLDGVALARRLREQRPRLPVVLITGFNNAGIADGEFVTLRKPCAPAELLGALQALITAARIAHPSPLAGHKP